MASSTQAIRTIQWYQRRGLTVPSICYDTCNNAAIEGQRVGKNPEICDPDSGFYTYYRSCRACIDTYAADNGQAANNDYLDPSLSQEHATPTAETAAVTVPYTATVDGLETIWSFTRIITSFAPLPDTTVVIVRTTENGHDTVWSFTKTFTHLPRSSSSKSVDTKPTATSHTTPKSTSQAPDDATASIPTDTATNKNKMSQAWLAGPIVGAVAGAGIILFATLFLLRLRKRNMGKRNDHELHGESGLKSELEAKDKPQELNGQILDVQPAELPAHE
ncbi:hypothetical protein F4808DRAFT_463917 [Astrocystis sublimbata]|nr:hypothetical protein F4808DRAFT_463917 [Astrocystis sublimbata]